MNLQTAAPEDAVVEEPQDAPAPGRNLVVVVAVVGVVVVALAGAAWLLGPRLLPSVFGSAKAGGASVEVPMKATVALGPVVVNIPGETRRYLRVAVSVGVPGPKDVKEIEEARAQLLDLVIAVVSGSDADELTSDEGRVALKETLLERIHEELHLERVGRVYFTEFVVQ
jgi:flagellar basal body-associated protein FliL